MAHKIRIGVIALMLFVTISEYCNACVTINTQNDTYIIDPSGCVNTK